MKVTYKKHKNTEKNNEIEFLLINWYYEDGGDYLAEIFHEEFGMLVDEKIDGIYCSITKLHLEEVTYELWWHEDFGNMIYSIDQTEEAINTLEERLNIVLNILNEKLKDI